MLKSQKIIIKFVTSFSDVCQIVQNHYLNAPIKAQQLLQLSARLRVQDVELVEADASFSPACGKVQLRLHRQNNEHNSQCQEDKLLTFATPATWA